MRGSAQERRGKADHRGAAAHSLGGPLEPASDTLGSRTALEDIHKIVAPDNSEQDLWTAREIMRTEILTVSIDAPLSEAERLLGEFRIGGLPVTNETGHIIGVVSMRDLLERYSQDPDGSSRRHQTGFYHPASDDDLDELEAFSIPEESSDTVGDIMTPHVYTVGADATLSAIAAKMVEYNVHRILVTENGRKVGFISSMDVLKALAND